MRSWQRMDKDRKIGGPGRMRGRQAQIEDGIRKEGGILIGDGQQQHVATRVGAVLVAGTIVLFVIGYIVFQRQEVRA